MGRWEVVEPFLTVDTMGIVEAKLTCAHKKHLVMNGIESVVLDLVLDENTFF